MFYTICAATLGLFCFIAALLAFLFGVAGHANMRERICSIAVAVILAALGIFLNIHAAISVRS